MRRGEESRRGEEREHRERERHTHMQTHRERDREREPCRTVPISHFLEKRTVSWTYTLPPLLHLLDSFNRSIDRYDQRNSVVVSFLGYERSMHAFGSDKSDVGSAGFCLLGMVGWGGLSIQDVSSRGFACGYGEGGKEREN